MPIQDLKTLHVMYCKIDLKSNNKISKLSITPGVKITKLSITPGVKITKLFHYNNYAYQRFDNPQCHILSINCD
jgi:hypothetical protein